MKVTTEKFYNRIAALYPVIDILLRRQKQQFFRIIDNYPFGRLLEIGIGNGSHLKYFNSHEIIGIDTSHEMLAQASKITPRKLELYQMNAEALAFSNERFDYVVMSHVIAVVKDPERVLLEIHRVLKPGGKVFILNHFTPNNWLKFFDIVFERIGSMCHLKSLFTIESIKAIDMFTVVQELPTGPLSYFKILIYEKAF